MSTGNSGNGGSTRGNSSGRIRHPDPRIPEQHVNNLRLWSAKASREFDLNYFNDGDYIKAVSRKIGFGKYHQGTVSQRQHVRRKGTSAQTGILLCLGDYSGHLPPVQKSPYRFLVFPDQVAIQLNDTHPAISIPELMRILVDIEGLAWDAAWDITVKTFGYTNHTVLRKRSNAGP